jgi:hypothetical protein
MTLPSWLPIGLALGAATAGGAVVVVVLTTSGPFALSQDDPAPPSAAAEETATATHPSPSPTVDPQPDQLAPDEPFDPARLPPVDTTGWVAYTGPRGELTVRVPPSWWAETRAQTDYTGTTVIGDYVKVLRLRPGIVPGRPVGFAPQPGDVWADISTVTAPTPLTRRTQTFHELKYVVHISGRSAEITAFQTDQPETFEPGVGALSLYVSASTPSGGYLEALVTVALPADLTTIAEAQAILTGIVLR